MARTRARFAVGFRSASTLRALSCFVLVLLLLILSTGRSAMSEEAVSAAPKAKFFLVGGNADTVIADFVRLAGGPENAYIAVITYAIDKPDEAADGVQNLLSAVNARHTMVISAGPKDNLPKEGLPKGVNALWFAGGDQNRLMRLMPPLLLKQLVDFGGLIAGNSAGAMAATPQMISGGLEQGVIRAQQLKLAEGLVLIPGAVVDSHVGQRNRDARCAAALAVIPDVDVSIGLDEDTAIYIDGNDATVYGVGHARIYRRGPGFSTNVNDAPKGTVASVKNVVVSFLSAGDQFKLHER